MKPIVRWASTLALALLSFFAAVPALAQTPQATTPTTPNPPCYPGQFEDGSGTRFFIGGNGVSKAWGYYWCPGKYAPFLVWRATTDMSLIFQMAKETANYTNFGEAIRGLYGKYGVGINTTTTAFKAVQTEMEA